MSLDISNDSLLSFILNTQWDPNFHVEEANTTDGGWNVYDAEYVTFGHYQYKAEAQAWADRLNLAASFAWSSSELEWKP